MSRLEKLKSGLTMLSLLTVLLFVIAPITITDSTPVDSANSLVPENSERATADSLSGYVAPDGRANLMMAYDSESDVVIIYGGWNEPLPYELGDTWSYDYNTNTFVNMSPASAPPVREVSAMAYDSQSDRIIMFGGLEDYETSLMRNDTWAYDYNTNTWTDMSPANAPSPRNAFGMVYDSESDRIILFGGLPHSNETWAYDFETNTWTQMSPANAPSPRYFPAMAYDEESDIVILFGGRSIDAKESDTWSYDCNTDTWTELSPAANPVGRRAHSMTYDDESDRIVLFGGSDDADIALGDVWHFDYNTETWSQATPDYGPYARLRHTLAYDSESDVVIAFGGTHTSYYEGPMIANDTTWAYDANEEHWRQISPITQAERNDIMMAFDSESNMTIIFGGRDNMPATKIAKDITWAYDASIDAYFNMSPVLTPGPKSNGFMVYDAQSDVCVVFGGFNDSNDAVASAETWLYDFNTNTWTNASPATNPPARYVHRMAYDSKSDRTILFGGFDGSSLYGDTWAYDVEANTWEEMTPATSPSGRVDHWMSYDWESDRVILFGGQPTSGYISHTNDTWAYDYDTNTWQQMSPALAPSDRSLHAMAYDNESDVVVLFGGIGPSDVNYDDTWHYDFNSDTWTQAAPDPHPGGRLRHSAAYDSHNDVMIIYGGVTGDWHSRYDIDTDTTWSYDENTDTWTKMSEIPEPQVTTAPTTTTTTTTTTTNTTEFPPIPLEFVAIAIGGVVIILLVVLVAKQRR